MKPEPVNQTVVCSVCGLDWKRHGEDPTLEKCVELLKKDLGARAYQQYWSQPAIPNNPNPMYPAIKPHDWRFPTTWSTNT